MKNKFRVSLAIVLCLSIISGISGFGLLMSKKAEAAPWFVPSGSTVTSLSGGSVVTVSFTKGGGDQNGSWYSFKCPSTGIYECYTYDNTNNCDPVIMCYDSSQWIGTQSEDSGVGFNEYAPMSMTKDQTYYFLVYCDNNIKTSCKFVIRNVSSSAVSIANGEKKTVSVDSTSGVKWIKYNPPATRTRYRLMVSSGDMYMYYEDDWNADCNSQYQEYYNYYACTFGTKNTHYFFIRDIKTSSITISASTDTTNIVTVTDNNTSLTGKTSEYVKTTKPYFYRIKGSAANGSNVELSVKATISDNSTPYLYLWTDNKGNTLSEGTSATLNYNVSGDIFITCTVFDKYYNRAKIVYGITATGSVTKYQLTVDKKNGTKGDITCSISSGSYEAGNKSFTVSSKNACRVFSTTNNSAYTQIKATTSGNTHTYTVNLNASTTVVIAKLGDVNLDGAVDSADALLVLRYDVNKATFNSLQKLIADVNGDNKIDSADALLILRLDVNKTTFSW